MKDLEIKNTFEVEKEQKGYDVHVNQTVHNLELQEMRIAIAHGRWTSIETGDELNDYVIMLQGEGKFILDKEVVFTVKEGEHRQLEKGKIYRVECVDERDVVFLFLHNY